MQSYQENVDNGQMAFGAMVLLSSEEQHLDCGHGTGIEDCERLGRMAGGVNVLGRWTRMGEKEERLMTVLTWQRSALSLLGGVPSKIRIIPTADRETQSRHVNGLFHLSKSNDLTAGQ